MRGTTSDVPLSLVTFFERAEQLFAAKPIVTATATGVQTATMGDWAVRTRKLGGVLDTLGVTGDGRVGTFAWNTQRHLELYFAAPCTGRVLHPLNIRLFADQIVYTANHAEDEVVFVDRSVAAILVPLLADMKTVRHVVLMDDGKGDVPAAPASVTVHDYEELLAAADPVDFHVDDEWQAASMCYTSGTTGNPKGVAYSHRSCYLHTMAVLGVDSLAVSERDVVLPVVPMFHANSWGLAHAGVAAGATLVLPGPDLSPPALATLIVEQRVTLAAGVPTIWMGVLPELAGRDTSALRSVVCGGSAVPKALSEGYRAAIGLPIDQAWGMTETNPIAATMHLKSTLGDLDREAETDVRSTVGLITTGLSFRVVEPDTGERLPWDGATSGELQVRGPWVTASYYDDDRRDSFTADGWLRTGDVATVDAEGYVRLVDRTKDLIKSGGEWISSVDLENELMAHPKIAEAAVVGVPHPKWSERPLACVVVRAGEELTAEEVLAFLRERLAKWQVPDDVVFIDEVPKTATGKFSKRDLRTRFEGHRLPTA